jgi:peptidoglycan/LPS O-acetylase OafA/YrhL
VLPAVLGVLYLVSTRPLSPERTWAVWGVAAAGAVWLAVQFRQVKESNPLARLGDYTYGLFLFHVPLLFVVLYAARRAGWEGRHGVLWLAGAVAIVGGMLFGRLESAVHARLRPLAKMKIGDVWNRIRLAATRGLRSGARLLGPRSAPQTPRRG